jgi:hypothetical protein
VFADTLGSGVVLSLTPASPPAHINNFNFAPSTSLLTGKATVAGNYSIKLRGTESKTAASALALVQCDAMTCSPVTGVCCLIAARGAYKDIVIRLEALPYADATTNFTVGVSKLMLQDFCSSLADCACSLAAMFRSIFVLRDAVQHRRYALLKPPCALMEPFHHVHD